MPQAIGPAIGVGSSLLGGIFGGNRQSQVNDLLKKQQQAGFDLSNQAGTDYNRLLSPAESAYNSMITNGGYNPQEQASMYLTPQEQAAAYYSPQEQAAMMISPQDAQGITNLALAPISGAATGAIQRLGMQAAARGNYAPGMNATAEEVQREAGRQGAEASLNARLGVNAANRQAAQVIANQRANTALQLGQMRTGTAANIGNARINQQNTGAYGLSGLAGQAAQRQIGGLSTSAQAIGGAANQPNAFQSGLNSFGQNGGFDALGSLINRKPSNPQVSV